MSGARCVHDELIRYGWEMLVADAQKVKGLAPLACKTDKVDARVLAELSHLVKHRAILENRVHAALFAFGYQVPMADLFGVAGRQLLAGLQFPEPWRGHVQASLELIDDLDRRIGEIERWLKRSGADHRYIRLLMTDCRGPLSKDGPRYVRWALMDAAIAASKHPLYKERYQRTRPRFGRQRGPKVAQIELARKLTEAIWYMLTRNPPFKPFAPAGAVFTLTA